MHRRCGAGGFNATGKHHQSVAGNMVPMSGSFGGPNLDLKDSASIASALSEQLKDYPNSEAVRESVKGLITKPCVADLINRPLTMTVAELCRHFEQRELAQEDTWRSYSTRRNYHFLLKRWIIPRWGNHELSQVRTIEVESWLRSLARARSTCAKIRNLMSVLFNHAWRHEFFDRNPIKLVRQSAKDWPLPMCSIPSKSSCAKAGCLPSKWGDIDFSQDALNVTRLIAYGIGGRCKTEASQKPVPVHSILAAALILWRDHCKYPEPDDWVFANDIFAVAIRIGVRQSFEELSGLSQ